MIKNIGEIHYHKENKTNGVKQIEFSAESNQFEKKKSKVGINEMFSNRILRHRKIIVNKSDTVWNWAFNTPCKSLKGMLVLFEEEKSYTRDTSTFFNPKIQKVSVIVEGKPNQLYTQGMMSFEQ